MGTVYTVACIVKCCSLTDSFWNGLLLGSCFAEIGLLVLGFVILVTQVGFTAAIAAFMKTIDMIKKLFGK